MHQTPVPIGNVKELRVSAGAGRLNTKIEDGGNGAGDPFCFFSTGRSKMRLMFAKERPDNRVTAVTLWQSCMLMPLLAPRHITRHVPFSFSFRSWARDFFKSSFRERFRLLSSDNSSCGKNKEVGDFSEWIDKLSERRT